MGQASRRGRSVSIRSDRPWSRKLLQQGKQFITSESVPLGQGEKVLCLRHYDPFLRFAHHGDTPTSSELEDPLVSKEPQSTEHCVRVDPQYDRHVFGGWEALTRSHVSICNVLANLGRYLIVQGDGIAEQLDILHGNMQSITIMATTRTDPRVRPMPEDPEQLVVREARRRQRRRQLLLGITILAVATIAIALWFSFGSGRRPPGNRSIHAGTSEVSVRSFVSSVIDHTATARTAGFTFTWRASAIYVHGSGTVNFVSPSYSIDETISGLPLVAGSTRLTRTTSGHFYQQTSGEAPTEQSGNGLMSEHAGSATNNGSIAILARSPAGSAFGLLSLVPANHLRLMGVGSGEVAGTPATTYLFGYSGQCQGTVQTKVWATAQGRILQVTTTQIGSGGKRIETMSLTITHFGLPVAVVPPSSAALNATNNSLTKHVGNAGSNGSVGLVPICSS